MLAELRSFGCRLAVLTNCDEDLFAPVHRKFQQPFDLVITAERVRDYKPALTHFRTFQEMTGVLPMDWVHVACSWVHDIAPARELGIRSIWLDRDRTGHNPAAATARIENADQLPAVIKHLLSSHN
jgi:2-haloacid dehalogenase